GWGSSVIGLGITISRGSYVAVEFAPAAGDAASDAAPPAQSPHHGGLRRVGSALRAISSPAASGGARRRGGPGLSHLAGRASAGEPVHAGAGVGGVALPLSRGVASAV